jgi:hypothetical protein
MGQELTQVLCPECGTAGEADPQLSHWQCDKCGAGFFLRRCSACNWVSYVDGLQGFRMPWPCTWCGRFNRGFSQNQDPAAASAAELAAELTRYSPLDGAAGPGGGGEANPASPAPAPAPAAGTGPAPRARDPGDGGQAFTADNGSPGTAALPGLAPPRPGRRQVRRVWLSLAMVAACAAVATVVLTAGDPGAMGMAAGPGSTTRAVRVTAGQVGTVDFQGAPGQLTVVGTGSSQVTLTGQLHSDGSAPTVSTRFDRTARILVVSVQCAPATQCTQNLRLAVPAGTGTTVRQPSGRIVLTGLAGPLRITAANVDISASGLRSTELAAVITSGHLSAAFTTPPRQVSITLTSAQAALRLPDGAAYRVTQQVTSGYVRVAIPRASGAPRSVTVRIDSGELELLPA